MALTLNGRVRDTYGSPVPAVAVTIRRAPASVPDLSVLTDGSGRFTLHDLPSGDYVLALVPQMGGEAAEVTLSLRAGDGPHEFVLPG